MPLLMARPFEMPDGVRVNIGGAIHPGPLPTGVIDEDRAVFPCDAVGAPSPWPEHRPYGHAEAEAYSGADVEARTWGNINNRRIVVRNSNELTPRRQDRNIGTAAHDDLWAGPQIAEVAGMLAHFLHGV